MGKVIGIDIGTTNSVIAFLEGKKPIIILSPEGNRLLPSMIAFTKDGVRQIGFTAKSQFTSNINTIYNIKRLMGKSYSEVEPYLNQFNYEIVKGEEDKVKIRIFNKLYPPEQISAMILQKLKESAEHYINEEIEGAIITVPAYFNDSQRQATKDAAEIAGLNVLRIINEPTAASLAFSFDINKTFNVVAYDFGGGTIDISVLEISNNIIKVLATAGDINLGGSDFDIDITNLLLKEIKNEYNIDLSENKLALQRIREAAENAKKEISSIDKSEINLPFIADTTEGPIHYIKYLSREEFENLISAKVKRTIDICKLALQKANLTCHDIDEILLVGGSTRIPCVQKAIKKFFGKEPNKKVNPDEIVAMGAAIQGSIVRGEFKDILLLDITPLSLGVRTYGGTFTKIVDANTPIPINRSLVFTTAEKDQDEVEIMVYQGESEKAEENKLLGKFTLTEISPAPQGVPRIEVTFSININGILKVSAINLSTKNKNEIIVSQTSLLSNDEIEKYKIEFEELRNSDSDQKETIRIKNKVLNMVYSIEQYLKNLRPEPIIVSKCSQLIENANKEVESDRPTKLKRIEKKLQEMESKLEAIAQNLGVVKISQDRENKSLATLDSDYSVDDTKPYKTAGKPDKEDI